MTAIREKTIKGLQVGDTFSVSRTFTVEDVLSFAQISKDYNPVHFEERFALAKNFRGKICHGLLVGSMISEIGGEIGWLATEMTFLFRQPVYIGETIICSLTIQTIKENGWADAKAIFKNQQQKVVLEATLKGFLPGIKEKEIMKSSFTSHR